MRARRAWAAGDVIGLTEMRKESDVVANRPPVARGDTNKEEGNVAELIVGAHRSKPRWGTLTSWKEFREGNA
jgi:hypothetical protein